VWRIDVPITTNCGAAAPSEMRGAFRPFPFVSGPSGDAATGWALIGQHYTTPVAVPPDSPIYISSVSAAPSINYQYNWGINWFNTAQVTLQAMDIALGYAG
jgi:hypothetical protein